MSVGGPRSRLGPPASPDTEARRAVEWWTDVLELDREAAAWAELNAAEFELIEPRAEQS